MNVQVFFNEDWIDIFSIFIKKIIKHIIADLYNLILHVVNTYYLLKKTNFKHSQQVFNFN